METFKVTLTVLVPMPIQGLYQGENAEGVHEDLLPKLEEAYGTGNVEITSIDPATEEEIDYLAQAMVEHKKSMN